MMVFKCKMCGGNLKYIEGQSYGTCDSCGSTMTLPKAADERIVNLFNRANHYRLQNEFDKALATYENILNEDNNNAEAHWGCVISRYGIEYVEDPKTNKRIPTCHRVQSESILTDLDYKAALQFADVYAKELYQKEALEISKIQKQILSVANNEKPYDIFICYKETDEDGKRTKDSLLAQDIYYQLHNAGYKIFFSRITLEDKLGQEYEPYIFSALNSAKVMLVVGTKAEYFNAVWVKNEWSRFLALAKQDKQKILIPCYRDMDAYDLPEELAMFQSQDMSKIGFIQDLVHGIQKVIRKQDSPDNETTIQQTINYAPQETALLKRAFLSIEGAEWDKADKLLENALNINPEDAKAYLGKLMIELKVCKEDDLANQAIDFSKFPNFQRAFRFGDDNLKELLTKYLNSAKEKFQKSEQVRIEKEKQEQEQILAEQKKRAEIDNFAKSFNKNIRSMQIKYCTIAAAVYVLFIISFFASGSYISASNLVIGILLGSAASMVSLFASASIGSGITGCVKENSKDLNEAKNIAREKFAKAQSLTRRVVIICSSIAILIGMIYSVFSLIHRHRFTDLYEKLTTPSYVNELVADGVTKDEIENMLNKINVGTTYDLLSEIHWYESEAYGKHVDFTFCFENDKLVSVEYDED